MTEEWDFWLNEEAGKQSLSEDLLLLLEQLKSKQAFFRYPMRGSYVLFCEGSQVIDTILCHPKSLLLNPAFLSAAVILLCLSRRLAINSAHTKEEAITVIQKYMENLPKKLTDLFKLFLRHIDPNFELSLLELEQKFARRFFEGLKFCYEMPKGMQIQNS